MQPGADRDPITGSAALLPLDRQPESISGRLFTHEQRGEDEVVSCFDAASGERLWESRARSRFQDVVAGAGPRSTPTWHQGKLYTFGAKAILSALDADSGRLLWQRDLVEELDPFVPVWGFASSPVVTEGLVIVHAGGKDGKGLVAYAAETGEPAWSVPTRGMLFASAQLLDFHGQELVLFGDADGLMALEPASGETLWRFTPSVWESAPMVQPQKVGESTLLTAVGDGEGVARLEVNRDEAGSWAVSETWSSRGLKPSFNDFVVYDGAVYGFDQNIFAAIDLETGERHWKRGRYGFGQVLLLSDTGQLMIAAEKGEVVLLAADTSGHRELGRMKALDAKTWNHPIIADGALFVRNGEEMVAFDL